MALGVLSIIFAIVQFTAVSNYYFPGPWDIQTTSESAHELNSGRLSEYHQQYLERNPNNKLITATEYLVLKLSSTFFNYTNLELAMALIQTVLCTLTGVMLWFIFKRITKSATWSWIAWVVFIAFVGFNPWLSIAYTDALGLIFPCLILFIYTFNTTKPATTIIKWSLMGIVAGIGFNIKPQTFLALIAILAVEFFGAIPKQNRWRNLKKFAISSVITVIALLMSVFAATKLANHFIPTDSRLGTPLTHYLLMGLNYDTKGGFHYADMLESAEAIKQHSNDKNPKLSVTIDRLEAAWNRIQEMGPVLLLKHLYHKTQFNYNSGLFLWSVEGDFYNQSRTDYRVQNFMCGIYYNPLEGPASDAENCNIFFVYGNTMQAIWLLILLTSLFAFKLRQNKLVATLMLSIIFLTIFELVFEARSRYLFTYAPFYVMLSILGVRSIYQYIAAHLAKRHTQNTPAAA